MSSKIALSTEISVPMRISGLFPVWGTNRHCYYRRTGFTLLEILIVLGVIVAVFGLSFSGIRRLHAKNQLNSTTQYLQNILYKTRLDAIKTGKAIVFRYRYDSPVFEIIPKDLFDQREQNRESSPAIAIGAELLQESPTGSTDSILLEPDNTAEFYRIYQKMLPNSIVFGSKQPEAATTLNENGQLQQPISIDHWSAPILFFPNGRTSQTTLKLQTTSRYRFQQELTLRGLTGTAKINK